MADLSTYLSRAAKENASDLFLVPGAPVSYKLDGQLLPMDAQKLTPQQSELLIDQLYQLAERSPDTFKAT